MKIPRRQNADMKKFPYGRPKYFSSRNTKFSHSATLRPVLCTHALRFNRTEMLDTARSMYKLKKLYKILL